MVSVNSISTESAASASRARGRDKVLLGAQVADQVRAMIRDQRLEDGDPLPAEATLADQFGVSQRVIRDALRVLSQQGVIRTQQGKPAVVAERRPLAIQNYFRLALEDGLGSFDELLELRQALEVRAAGRAALTATEAEIEDVRAKLEKAERATRLDERVDADLAFHFALVAVGGNRFFTAILDSLSTFLAQERRRGQELTESSGGDHQQSHREHREIMSAIARRDSEAAERAMRAHLDRVQREFSRGRESAAVPAGA